MKSKDIQNVVLRLHEQELCGREISEHLGGEVSKSIQSTDGSKCSRNQMQYN
jgi:hypothetical protein